MEISFEENQLKDQTLDASFEELESRFEMCPCGGLGDPGGGGSSNGGTGVGGPFCLC